MRKLTLALLLALFVGSIASVAYAIDDPSYANYVIKRSTGAKQSDSPRVVRLVRYSVRGNDGSSQTRDLVSNDLVVWDTNSDDAVSVRMTSTSADGAVAGVVCSNTILTADNAQNFVGDANGQRNWGWIVVDGFATVRVQPGTNGAAIGDPVLTSRDTGAAATFETLSVDSTADVTTNAKLATKSAGFFFDTLAATDTTAEIYVQLN